MNENTSADGRTDPVETLESLTAKAKAFDSIRSWIDGGIFTEWWTREDRAISLDNYDGRGYIVEIKAGTRSRVYESKDYHFCTLEVLIETALNKFEEEAQE